MNKLSKLLLCLFILFSFADITSAEQFINDDFVELTLKDKQFEEFPVNNNYNYESTEFIPIKLQIVNEITTKKNLQDSDIILFKVKQNVKHNKEVILKKDTIVKARVKTYITRGWNGIPGQIIIDDFQVPNIDSRKLKSTYINKGLNLTLLIMPVKWVLTPIPFVGSFTNLIIGGHAKITPKDTIILYYYPDWHI